MNTPQEILGQVEALCVELEANTSDRMRIAEIRNMASVIQIARHELNLGVFGRESMIDLIGVRDKLLTLKANPSSAGSHEKHRGNY